MKKSTKWVLLILSLSNCVFLYLHIGWWFIAYVFTTIWVFYNLSNLFLLQTPIPHAFAGPSGTIVRGYRTIFYNIFFLLFLLPIPYLNITDYFGGFNWGLFVFSLPVGIIVGVSASRLFLGFK